MSVMRLMRRLFQFVLGPFYIFRYFLQRSYIHPGLSVNPWNRLHAGSRVRIKKAVFDLSNGNLILGDGVWINTGVSMQPLVKINVGRGTTIQRDSILNGEVSIGDDVLIGPRVFISSGSHVYNLLPGKRIREQEAHASKYGLMGDYSRKIEIGDDVWIGVNAVVMPGVKIASHSIIGANSVVTKDVGRGEIVAGVPAKKIAVRQGFEKQE